MTSSLGRRPVPFVGRSAEVDLLAGALEAALEQFATQTILLVGEQGVGKTRMIDHWVSCLDLRQVRVLRASARQGDRDYRVFRRLLQSRFPRPEDPEAQVEVIRAQVEDVMQDRRVTEILHFLGTFLGLAVRGSPFLTALEDAPGQQEQIARTVLCRFLELDAAQTPLLLILDDLHLADQPSLDLFKELTKRLSGARVVLVGLGRPELLARDSELRSLEGDVQIMQLGPLSAPAAEELTRSLLAPAKVIPGTLLDRALELSRGNPLFLEMLVSVLLQDGTIEVEDSGAWTIDAERAAKVELPMSVEEAVHARIAVLAPAERELLEKASMLGSVFWRSVLVCFARLEREVADKARVWTGDTLLQELREQLEELVERDYLVRMPDSSIPGEVEYAFKRVAEREQVALLVDPQRRKRFHLLAAQWLDARLKERSEPQLEELARHYEDGGAAQRAGYCYVFAGDKARARFANPEAIAYYERGLALLDEGDTLAKIEALHNLGDVCALLGRYTSAQEHFAEMLRLAWLVDHRGKGGAAHRRLGRLHRTLGAIESAITHLRMAIRLFRLSDDKRGVAATLDDLGGVLADKGEYQAALDHHHRALGLKRDVGDPRAIAVSLHNLGIAHEQSGSFKEAVECYVEALEVRRTIADRLGVADTLDRLAGVHRAKSDYSRARELWLEALAVAHEVGDRAQEARILLRLGESLIQLGHLDDARGRIDEAIEMAGELGDQLLRIETRRTMAELKLACGDLAGARAEAEAAQTIVEQVQLEPQRGLALRSLAEIAAAQGTEEEPRVRALTLYGQAADVFCALGNDLELARTYALLSNYHDRLGSWQEARSYRQRADEVFRRLEQSDRAEPLAAALELDESITGAAEAFAAMLGDGAEEDEDQDAARGPLGPARDAGQVPAREPIDPMMSLPTQLAAAEGGTGGQGGAGGEGGVGLEAPAVLPLSSLEVTQRVGTADEVAAAVARLAVTQKLATAEEVAGLLGFGGVGGGVGVGVGGSSSDASPALTPSRTGPEWRVGDVAAAEERDTLRLATSDVAPLVAETAVGAEGTRAAEADPGGDEDPDTLVEGGAAAGPKEGA